MCRRALPRARRRIRSAGVWCGLSTDRLCATCRVPPKKRISVGVRSPTSPEDDREKRGLVCGPLAEWAPSGLASWLDIRDSESSRERSDPPGAGWMPAAV